MGLHLHIGSLGQFVIFYDIKGLKGVVFSQFGVILRENGNL
ncbi:hypothetical protein D1BOALGB6SA_9820 [Olavius sp. associated proteobacterium Delta 1]|nr:hypothetical protein D1BOALGB6SA_9820 [Olavius sp. associated proteobacterium Delta 1]